MTGIDQVRTLVEGVLDDQTDLIHVERQGATLRVTVDRAGGIGVDDLAQVTRRVSSVLDEADPIPGRYTLEVSSPGLERPLRTPEHFRHAVGTEVKVKTSVEVAGQRRFRGVVGAVDGGGVVLRLAEDQPAAGTDLRLAYDQIEQARTTFEWGPAPKPVANRAKRKKKAKT
jgi:ribosome maturation factor RimP